MECTFISTRAPTWWVQLGAGRTVCSTAGYLAAQSGVLGKTDLVWLSWCQLLRRHITPVLARLRWWSTPEHGWQQHAFRLTWRRTDIDGHQPLPSRLQLLTFGSHFNQSLDHVTLPSGLQHLTFGYNFNQSLDHVTLPSGLQHLTFGYRFNQSLDHDTAIRMCHQKVRGRKVVDALTPIEGLAACGTMSNDWLNKGRRGPVAK